VRAIALLAVAVVLTLPGCVRAPYAPAAPTTLPTKSAWRGSWAPLESASIRPGVRVITPMGGGAAECTSNFVFRRPDNATLYLGVAAHCFGEDPSKAVALGTKVQVADIPHAGKVAYNGWLLDPSDANDFGLVELRNDATVRPHVNPSVLHFGGPTMLADSSQALPGTHVITYGHSVQRGDDDPENPREGYVLQHDGGRTTVVTDHPGIQGDSGSGLMTNAGAALGVLSMGTTNPTNGGVPNRQFPSVNYYVDLDAALAYAKAHGPPELANLELVTSPLLAAGQLPLSS